MNLYFRLLLTVLRALRAPKVVPGEAAAGKQGLVPNANIYRALGYDGASPALPDDLQAWIEADRLLHPRAKSEVA